ncbi:FAD-dependent oxidoreductase [Streptomyces sp. NPDC050619]|uniref:FAD-dependent oxidoreductase n=1 Tax=Streptomyces sp. NPDC050619 TaxID=3157214 RepID=UPI003413B7DC
MIAVVGVGLMRAATAWQFARRGHEVTLIEASDIGHRRGAADFLRPAPPDRPWRPFAD